VVALSVGGWLVVLVAEVCRLGDVACEWRRKVDEADAQIRGAATIEHG